MKYPVIISVTICSEYDNWEEKEYCFLYYVDGTADITNIILEQFTEEEIVKFSVEYVGCSGDLFQVKKADSDTFEVHVE